MNANRDDVTSIARLPVFFLLVFAVSIPFWVLASVTHLQLMPGLSISALAGFAPMVAALIMVRRDKKSVGMWALLKRSFDYKRIQSWRWLVPVLLLMPAVSLVVYGLMRWMAIPVPPAQFNLLLALLMFIAFFLGGLGEELGWSGYALDPLQARWGALGASLLLGLVGIVWHLVPLFLYDRSFAWIGWWCLYALTIRIFAVWLYNNTGKSVLATALFHATVNLAFMFFPINGSHFDMRLGGLVMAGAALLVILIWGPKHLSRRSDSKTAPATF